METNQHITLIATLIGSIIATMILMPWLSRLCHKHQLTDETDDKNHFQIPRIGGIVFAPAMSFGMGIAFAIKIYNGNVSDMLKYSTFLIAMGVMAVYLLGIIDDIFGLNKWQKRAVRFVASIAFPLCGLYINNLHGLFGLHTISPLPGIIITMLFTILTVRGLESLNNFDGLAGTIGLVPLLVLGTVYYQIGCYTYAVIAYAMSGTLAVFLYFNIFGDERIGTKVYMGHAGALLMSYCIVYLSLKYAVDNRRVMIQFTDAILLPYSLLALPIFEYIRVAIKANWYGLTKPMRREIQIQHILQKKGFTQLQVIGIFLVGDLIIIAINMIMHHLLDVSITWIFIMNIAIFTALLFMAESTIKPRSQETQKPIDFAGYHGKNGLVSIIMPTYNSERFVAESIDSILAQTYPNWELIITDDCSTDNTREILKSYAEKDQRIKVQANEKNGGAGVSRNKSIASAQGRYISFCDSDDRWTPDKLEKQLQFMKNKDVALCFAPYYSCDERSQYLGYISAPRRVNLFEMMCDNKMGFLTCTYDTHILGKHSMPKQRKRQDHALLLNLLKTCHYAYSVPEPLAHYRLHPGNMSSNKISLIKYNAQTYTEVFGWPKPISYAFLFTFFMPTYFYKRVKNILINIARVA